MSNKDIRKAVKPFLILFLLSLIIMYSTKFALVKKARSLLDRPILFLQRSVFSARQKLGDSLVILRSGQEKYQEKTLLEEKTRNLAVTSGQLSVCREESAAMRRLLAAPLPPAWNFIPAKVIGRYQQLKINVGKKAGVESGMVVIADEILVGKIDTAGDYTSSVILVTDSSVKIPVVIRTPGNPGIKARGLINGYFDERLSLSEVLKSEDIKEGDLVFSSGEDKSPDSEIDWLPDLLIGKIDKVEEGKEKVFKKAWAYSLLDLQNLRYVFVVKVVQIKK
ncbi:MAG TPA: rod shape-determining protein MreC [Candidatus Bathyarchaeia archaeon]|nr:rod shape-determining protein MreC [Candidatus Bathyarchaeia archaeon]